MYTTSLFLFVLAGIILFLILVRAVHRVRHALGRRPSRVAALDLARAGPQVDHVVADLLAFLVLLLREHLLAHERALRGHELLQEAHGDGVEEFGLVEAQILRLGRVHHELVDPLGRHLQREEVVVDDGGLDVLRVDVLAEGRAAQHSLQFSCNEHQLVQTHLLVADQQLHHDLLGARALLVLGEGREVFLFEGQVAEFLGNFLVAHFRLQLVEDLLELFIKQLADEGLQHSEQVLRVARGHGLLAGEALLLAQVELGRQLRVAAFVAVDFVEVQVLVAPREGRALQLVAVERALAGLEVVVDELVQAHIGGVAWAA